MSIAAMSTIAKLWKEPRCPSTLEWIKKMGRYIYIQWNIIKPSKKRNLAICNDMELEGIRLSEISQRKTNTI